MSVSSVSFNTDVNIRYDRLSSEYARLRSHAKILSEGIISERKKNEGLHESVRELEVNLRKIEAENESLSFRNDQLTKRVEKLQTELENNAHTKSKSKLLKRSKESKNLSQVEELENRISVLEEELQDKICQNMELVNQISELKQKHTEELSSLLDEHARKVGDEEFCRHGNQKREHKAERPVKSVKPLGQSLEISDSSSLTPSPQPPPINDAYLQVAESIQNVFQGFSTLFELLYQRTQIYPFDASLESLPFHVKKLASELTQCSQLLNVPIEIVQKSISKAEFQWSTDVSQLCCAFSVVVQRCKVVMPELLEQIAIDENKITWCDSQLEELNYAWCSNLCRLFDAMDSICHLVEVNACSPDIGDKFYAALEEGASVIKNLQITFATRWAIESRLPTANKRSCCIGTATSHCLSRLMNEMGKLTARVYSINGLLLSSDKDDSTPLGRELQLISPRFGDCDHSQVDDNKIDAVNLPLCSKGVDTRDFGCQASDPSSLSCDPLDCSGDSLSCNSDALSDQMMVDYLKAKVSTLETERESHLVDLSLLRRKLAHFGVKEVKDTGYSEVEILKQVNRERLRAVTDDLQAVQCAANYYKGECMILLRKNFMCMKQKQVLEETVQNMTQQIAALTDELKLVRHSYNEQLSQMTEHIADLNGRLADIEKEKAEKQNSSTQQRTGLKSLFMK